ncbi:AraC-like DNA-binding protein [Sphingobium sp. B2D3A]|uniref:helix-turn-helix domain-containing protein n=1 Tax=Sphingobium TaxID=165695 RepID=UPI0015EB28E3|nr:MULTISPECIES: helix-turn-helix domain-containing protein [Sphingobium]MCW2337288.1 AraC-like DNA-binding protein [Sphingobium sp. B2D3A]MCW2362520.1 AraC-like DNA-binding protein [Sphingobium sp. B10D3B]MCW2365684.1 AraC-like DNA-binding protein [Sphingobium sp. B7D2B]MCW2370270.1 AraC-like DNA-binding protein [Sphingobium sp. B11D3D]MCW2381141.1 AraC-like DNA-binding protein [Sphingobium sp. B2D3B]
MESYSTEAFPISTRAAAWTKLYSQQLNRVNFTPADRHEFAARLSLSHFGPIQLASIAANRSHIERTRNHIRPGAPRLYSFLMQARGNSVLDHCGHQAQLDQGDFVLCDSAAPHSFTLGDNSMIIMLRVDAGLIKKHLPTPERFCGLKLDHEVGLTAVMSAMLENLNTQVQSGFHSDHDGRFARHVLEMLSTAYAMGFDEQPEGSAVMLGRQSEVIRYIEDNLRDPELTPARVAEGLRISPRYLRTLFASRGEKASSYIVRRRLEECGKQLRNPAWAGHTLTEIAFAWGFNSAAHFTRTFHEHFGMAPRDYRRAGSN